MYLCVCIWRLKIHSRTHMSIYIQTRNTVGPLTYITEREREKEREREREREREKERKRERAVRFFFFFFFQFCRQSLLKWARN